MRARLFPVGALRVPGARGEVRWPLAALLSAILIAGLGSAMAWWMMQKPEPPPAAVSGGGEASAPLAAGEAPESAPPEAGRGSVAPADAPPAQKAPLAAPQREPAGARFHGEVRGPGGPIAGARVLWLPRGSQDYGALCHDARWYEEELDPADLPSDAVRRDLEARVLASTGPEGLYEMTLPESTGEAGALFAWAPGHEVKLRKLGARKTGPRAADDFPGLADSPGEEPPDPQPAAPTVQQPSGEPEDRPVASATPADPATRRDRTEDFELREAGTIEGTVTIEGEESASVVGVVVGVQRVNPEDSAMRALLKLDLDASAAAGRDGTYRVVGVGLDQHGVLPRTEGTDYCPPSPRERKRVSLGGNAAVVTVDFVLKRGARVHGVVLGEGDGPVEGAECSIWPADIMSSAISGDPSRMQQFGDRATRTGKDGAFEFRGVPPGEEYQVAARASGYALTATKSKLEEGQRDAEVEIRLERGWSISGHVVDADGNPVPDKEVSILPELGSMGSSEFLPTMGSSGPSKSDEAGAFKIVDLRPGTHDLIAGGIRPETILGRKGVVSVTLDGTSDATGVRIVYEAEGMGDAFISGFVVDTSGAPIADASVEATSGQQGFGAVFGQSAGQRAASGPDGKFVLLGLEEGPFTVEASKAGFQKTIAREVAANSVHLVLTLAPHARVRGRVVTSSGAAFDPNARVSAIVMTKDDTVNPMELVARLVGGGDSAFRATIRPDGSFDVAAPSGAIEVEARAAGFAPGRSEELQLAPGEVKEGVTIELSSGASIFGKVVDPAGEPVAGATVLLLPGGDAIKKDMLMQLMPGMFAALGSTATSGGDGSFELLHLAADAFEVQAQHEAFAPSAPVPVVLKRDQVFELGPVALRRGGTLRGRVLQQDKPYRGVMAQVMGVGPMKQGLVDDDGVFTFKGLADGEYMVILSDIAAMQKGSMKMKTRTVTVQSEAETSLEVVFGLGAKISGKVTGLEAGPMSMITLRKPGGPRPEELDPTDTSASVQAARYQAGMAMIRPDGAYEIEDIEPGDYILEVPRMPANITDMDAFRKMDRTPHFRKDIKVDKADVSLDIRLR